MNGTSQEIINRAKDFLAKNKLCVVSTISPESKPQSAVCLYIADDDMNFYFVTRSQTRKVSNLRSNKNVALVIGTELAPFTIQAEGNAEPVSGNSYDEFMNKFKERPDMQALYSGPFLMLPGADFTVFKVSTNWLRYMELNPATGEESYYQIIPSAGNF